MSENNNKNSEIILIDLKEAGDLIFKMPESEQYKKILENCSNQSSDFKQGAIFGAAMTFNYISAYAKKYIGIKNDEIDEQ